MEPGENGGFPKDSAVQVDQDYKDLQQAHAELANSKGPIIRPEVSAVDQDLADLKKVNAAMSADRDKPIFSKPLQEAVQEHNREKKSLFSKLFNRNSAPTTSNQKEFDLQTLNKMAPRVDQKIMSEKKAEATLAPVPRESVQALETAPIPFSSEAPVVSQTPVIADVKSLDQDKPVDTSNWSFEQMIFDQPPHLPFDEKDRDGNVISSPKSESVDTAVLETPNIVSEEADALPFDQLQEEIKAATPKLEIVTGNNSWLERAFPERVTVDFVDGNGSEWRFWIRSSESAEAEDRQLVSTSEGQKTVMESILVKRTGKKDTTERYVKDTDGNWWEAKWTGDFTPTANGGLEMEFSPFNKLPTDESNKLSELTKEELDKIRQKSNNTQQQPRAVAA